MKKIKFVALVLAIAMLSACLIGCGSKKIKVEAKVGVYVGDAQKKNRITVKHTP